MTINMTQNTQKKGTQGPCLDQEKQLYLLVCLEAVYLSKKHHTCFSLASIFGSQYAFSFFSYSISLFVWLYFQIGVLVCHPALMFLEIMLLVVEWKSLCERFDAREAGFLGTIKDILFVVISYRYWRAKLGFGCDVSQSSSVLLKRSSVVCE
ncbi:hypothetical protein BD560DRAFT_427892 [Blakeslea trispora]|nr:hypothetical protein BD560DRAFT_427892 [Blakeslea trispora]